MVWDQQDSLWHQRFNELLEFKAEYGNCLVPNAFPNNPQLGAWVKRQRRQYKLFRQGLHSTITLERIKKLEKLGFYWTSCKTMQVRNSPTTFHDDRFCLNPLKVFSSASMKPNAMECTSSIDTFSSVFNKDCDVTNLKAPRGEESLWLEILLDHL